MLTRFQMLAGLLASLVASNGWAEVPDSIWTALRDRPVVVQRADGMQIEGQLLDASATSAVLMGSDGHVVEIQKAEVTSVRGDTASARATPDASEAPDALPEASLVALVRYTPETQLAEVVRSDPRFRALDSASRARLVESTREHRAGLGIALNCVVGFGVGSFVQGDSEAGTKMLLLDIAGTTAMVAGMAIYVDGFDEEWNEGSGGSNGTMSAGATLLLAGTGVIVANRIYGIVRPLRFHGRKNRILQQALGTEDLHASFFVVPDLTGARGMRAGLALRF
jgi:hypothetical protein